MAMNNESQIDTRRSFLKTTAIGATSVMLLSPKSVFGSSANSKIELGIIGCGGRGRFIGKKLITNVGDDIALVSAHDYFRDRLEIVQNMFDIPESRSYGGLQGYREILQSNVDGVIIESPPYFHPEHAAAAVEAGKHVWLAKPVAIDVPGCTSIKETGKKAEGKVAFLVDFQSRNSPFFVEAVKRVREGAIGEMISGQVFNQFPCGGNPDTTGMSPGAARLRCWVTDPVLSGACIVEQAVHAMDIANWIVGSHPTKAFGTGGLKARLNAGKMWDHFLVTYWYGDGPKLSLNCSQFMRGYEDLGARIYGKLGVIDAHYRAVDWGNGPVKITGDNAWAGTEFDNTWDIGVDNNCRDFVKAIRSGNYMNHADYSADSTMTSILGRTAAYRESVVTWDEILKENEILEMKDEL
jgi:predicted dehydrogenase